MRKTIAVLVTATVIGGCQSSAVDTEAEGRALMQLSRDWAAMVAAGDMESAFAVWAEDAVMLPPDMPLLEGRKAIRSYIDEASQTPGFSITWQPISVEVSSSGDLAFMVERNMTTMNDSTGNPMTIHGKAVTVWRRDAEGSWKNIADIWNTAPPPGN